MVPQPPAIQEPPDDAKAKHEKARAQPGWFYIYLRLNLEADELATTALNEVLKNVGERMAEAN